MKLEHSFDNKQKNKENVKIGVDKLKISKFLDLNIVGIIKMMIKK